MAGCSRLLILSCSQRKRPAPGLLPALERYDGPPFRVLRKFLRECPPGAQRLDIYVLSAEFGLIAAELPIPDYDRRMTTGRARELQPQALARVKHLLRDAAYDELLLSAGKEYLHALAGWQALLPLGRRVQVASGPPGRKLAALRDWLRGIPRSE